MKHRIAPTLLISAALVISTGMSSASAGETTPRFQTPILLTSCGQSPGAEMLKVILKRLNLEHELKPLAAAADLRAGAPSGKPYRSLIIVMGASLKGMGAAGISIDDEIKRTSALIEEARKRQVAVIGAHIEGMKRRSQGAAAGDTTDEQSIDAVAPLSGLLLVNKDGNADRRFTVIAETKKIPLIEVEKNLDLLAELKQLFGE